MKGKNERPAMKNKYPARQHGDVRTGPANNTFGFA